MFHITIENKGIVFPAREGQSVLEAAEGAGVEMPNSCRNGTCRTCLCRMTAGQVDYRITWPGLSPDEKREGDILPCVAVPDTDLRLVASARLRGR